MIATEHVVLISSGIYLLLAAGISLAVRYMGKASTPIVTEQESVNPSESVPLLKIEAVIVCVNYSDFLCWTLPNNRQHFEKLVVVTSKEDVKTQKLCEFWHVQCVITDRMYENSAVFNKGKAINEGLKALSGDGWVVHLDADIFLPPLFRKILNGLKLDQDGLYAMDRLMCDDFSAWLDYYTQPLISNESDIYVHLRPFPVGVRLAGQDYGGWLPIGFFQMWHQASKHLAYPEEHVDAGRSDLLFSLQFDRSHRHLLAEVVAIHLETKVDGKMGANWEGRKTPPFGNAILGSKTVPATMVLGQMSPYQEKP